MAHVTPICQSNSPWAIKSGSGLDVTRPVSDSHHEDFHASANFSSTEVVQLGGCQLESTGGPSCLPQSRRRPKAGSLIRAGEIRYLSSWIQPMHEARHSPPLPIHVSSGIPRGLNSFELGFLLLPTRALADSAHQGRWDGTKFLPNWFYEPTMKN